MVDHQDDSPDDPERVPDPDATRTDAGSPAREAPADETPPRSLLGPYRLVRKIGEGGMGVVWEAEQDQPIVRRVAIKLIKVGMDTEQVIKRFETERQTLALMNHPNIAKVLDAGATETGRPYFVMDFVDGVPLTRYCDGARLGTEERLDLFFQVCDGVQHAHQKGIIHRDLKPSNILVQLRDGRPVPVIIDFGIARAITRPLTEQAFFTEYGQIIGTPEYMSPEQAEPGADVDTRTDVYALGVILYELLIGVLPFDPRALRRAGFEEIRRIIREEPPSKPSTRLTSLGPEAREVAEVRHTDSRHLARAIQGDLDWITLKALEKERGRRYASVSELAADLRHHRANEPVTAGPPSVTYRAGKFVRRHRFGVATAAAIVLCLIAGIVGTTYGMVRALDAERSARIEATTATRVSAFLEGLFEVSDPSESRGNAITAREILDRGVESIRSELQDEPETRGRMLETLGRVYKSLGLYREARPLLEESLAIRERLPLASAEETAGALDSLSALLLKMRLPGEALELSERALAIRERQPIPDERGLGRTLNNLGLALWMVDRPDDARATWKRALEVRERSLGPGDPEVAKVLNNMAILEKAQGRSAEAAVLLERALSIVEARYGETHPQTASALNNLANAYRRLDRHAEAETALTRALVIQRKLHPGDHADVASTLNSLAVLYGEEGKTALAVETCREALAMRERIFGPDHTETAKSTRTLAELLERTGRSAPTRP